MGIAVHSSGELGIQLATTLHGGRSSRICSHAADSHYHHLQDDILVGGKMKYVNGAIQVPDGPGLGIQVNHDKVRQYAELYRELGGYPYDKDPGRPDGTRPCRMSAGRILRGIERVIVGRSSNDILDTLRIHIS